MHFIKKLISCALCSILMCGVSAGYVAANPVQEASFTNGISNGWSRVERWRDITGNLSAEDFPTDGRGDQTGQRATFFGTP